MEEEKKNVRWVSCRLGLEEGTNKVKLSCDDTDDFAFANGLLLRMSLDAAKSLLMDEAKVREEKVNESSECSE